MGSDRVGNNHVTANLLHSILVKNCVRGAFNKFQDYILNTTTVNRTLFKISFMQFTAVFPLFLRAQKAECFARLCHRLGVRLSVRPSVCPSVTLVSCIKTKSSPWTAPRSLVYRDKISCHWVQGFPSNEGVEEGYPP